MKIYLNLAQIFLCRCFNLDLNLHKSETMLNLQAFEDEPLDPCGSQAWQEWMVYTYQPRDSFCSLSDSIFRTVDLDFSLDMVCLNLRAKLLYQSE